MKNIKALSLLLLAAVLGLVAAVYANNWVGQRTQIAANKVVVAAVDIPAGSRLEPEMLTTIDWPSSALPNGAVTDPALLKARVVKLDVVRGEAVIEGKLAPVGTTGGLSAVIAEGKRAMTVRVNDVVGVAGFALPGNYVDILVHAQRDEGKGETKPISKTVLEHVLVLAVAQEAGRDDTKPKVVNAVTLELSLADSEKLDLARSIGTLSLALRNQTDEATVSTAGFTRNDLLGEPKVFKTAAPVRIAKPQAPQPARPGHCVEVIEMPDGSSRLSCFH